MTRFYLFLIFALLNFYSFAQVSTPNSLDESYTPSKNSILGSDQNKLDYSKIPTTANKHSLRINIPDLARSNFWASYEYNIIPQLSVNVGYGKPFGIDWIMWTVLQEISNESDGALSSNTDLTLFNILDNTTFKSGRILTGSLRYYLKKENVHHSSMPFLQFGVLNLTEKFTFNSEEMDSKYSNYNYSNAFIVPNNDDLMKSTTYLFNYGVQWNSGKGRIKFSHELSYGAGLKIVKFHEYQIIPIEIQNGDEIGVLIKKEPTLTKFLPCVNISYNIGIGWRKY